jgi:endonuclease/exonuclease/phosphatase family metal-dependent hydrolase
LGQPINKNDPAPDDRYALPAGLLSFGRRLLQFKILTHLRPLARRVAAVSEAPGTPAIKNQFPDHSERHCNTITVMSANLWHNWPNFWRLEERLEAFIRLVEDEGADILLLQEVSRTSELRTDEWLADRLRMAYVYTRANGHSAIGFEEGIAVFSRFPISQPELSRLGRQTNPFVRRMALGAKVETPCGDLLAFSVHLGILRRRNIDQMAHLRNWVGDIAERQPALVGGDFNAHESSPQIQQTRSRWLDTFRHLHPHADGHTHILRWPWGSVLRRRRLDYIFLLPDETCWKVVETRHLSTSGLCHSDHRAILTRLEPV